MGGEQGKAFFRGGARDRAGFPFFLKREREGPFEEGRSVPPKRPRRRNGRGGVPDWAGEGRFRCAGRGHGVPIRGVRTEGRSPEDVCLEPARVPVSGARRTRTERPSRRMPERRSFFGGNGRFRRFFFFFVQLHGHFFIGDHLLRFFVRGFGSFFDCGIRLFSVIFLFAALFATRLISEALRLLQFTMGVIVL